MTYQYLCIDCNNPRSVGSASRCRRCYRKTADKKRLQRTWQVQCGPQVRDTIETKKTKFISIVGQAILQTNVKTLGTFCAAKRLKDRAYRWNLTERVMRDLEKRGLIKVIWNSEQSV